MRPLAQKMCLRARQEGIELTPDEVQSSIYELLSQVRVRYRRRETNLETLKWLLELPPTKK